MRLGSYLHVTFVLSLLVSSSNGAPLLVNQALKGQVFGTPRSDDIPKRIAIGSDGSLYVAGITTPLNPQDVPWGDGNAGDLTGGSDVFVAKFSPSSQLLWAKRLGSSKDDIVNDLQVSKTGLYICGYTEGRLGRVAQGSADAFVMKISFNGHRLWKHPYQFGSRMHDSCHSLKVEPKSGHLYVTGNTNGRMFGSTSPTNGALHYFVAHFEELPHESHGLKLVSGRQQGSHGSTSGDSIAFGNDSLLIMTSNWDDHWDKIQVRTFLHILHRETLELRGLHTVQSERGLGFHGIRMLAAGDTDDVFMLGVSSTNVHSHLYHALLFSPTANESSGAVTWVRKVGAVFPNARMLHQIPSFAYDSSNKLLYVAGVEDGFFTDGSGKSGIVSVPFYKLHAQNGTVQEKWQRTTAIPSEREELTDIALDREKSVVYAGVFNGSSQDHASVVIGSFGSPGHSSRISGTRPIMSESYAQASGEGKDSMSKGETAGYIVLGVCGVGIVCAALFLTLRRRSHRNVPIGDLGTGAEVSKSQGEDHSQQEVVFSRTDEESMLVGGSAAPS